MTVAMRPSTYRAHAINDRVNYLSCFLPTAYGGLPGVNVAMGERSGAWPLVSGVTRPGRDLTVQIWILGADTSTLQKQLHDWFDPEDETPGALVVLNKDGTNARYVNALCQSLQPVPNMQGRKWIATLRVHGDVRFREVTPATDSWAITASGQTKDLTNNGQDDAYPIVTITPTADKTGGYAYKRFIAVQWRAPEGLASAWLYPVDICNALLDTAALVSGGKMQADGDDLRVFVDGIETDRWLIGINTTTTKVWCNVTFQEKQDSTLASGIAAGDVVISATTDISGFPTNGILKIDSEIITYTGKNNEQMQFTGCTRGAKGSSAASHSAAAAITWIQHDIWILYGNASATAPTVLGAGFEPIFNKTNSTNDSWDYDNFVRNSMPFRRGAWSREIVADTPVHYGGNHATSADPYAELGISTDYAAPGSAPEGRFTIYNPCGITAANFANGEKYTEFLAGWGSQAQVQSQQEPGGGWYTEYTIPAPSTAYAWESWSQSITLSATSRAVALYLKQIWYGYANKAEAADVTITLDNTATPTTTIGSETANYSLECTIKNNTTGDAIRLSFSMAKTKSLEVETDEKTVIYLLDNSPQMSALALTGGPRRDWLKLQPGSNTLLFTDTGTNGVTIGFSWEERHYQ